MLASIDEEAPSIRSLIQTFLPNVRNFRDLTNGSFSKPADVKDAEQRFFQNYTRFKQNYLCISAACVTLILFSDIVTVFFMLLLAVIGVAYVKNYRNFRCIVPRNYVLAISGTIMLIIVFFTNMLAQVAAGVTISLFAIAAHACSFEALPDFV